MNTTGELLKGLRECKGMSLANVQESAGIDGTLLSRIENGKRLPTDDQVKILSSVYGIAAKTLKVQLASDKIVHYLQGYEDTATDILKAAEDKMQYGRQYLSLFQDGILRKPIALESRRYIGSKAKLCPWIMETIRQNTHDVRSFCDIFAGTGIVSKHALQQDFEFVAINDLLYSNNVIYKAFFDQGYWEESKIAGMINEYDAIDADTLDDNYFSLNFGDKYYEYSTAKKIGYIRQDIEDRKSSLTEKEYAILLSTLIYNIDKLANTVGHFEAYIKKPIKHQDFVLRPIETGSYDKVRIYREDANSLAERLECDLVYIDPPYNSRQYCRFYHLYETLVKWDMPQLYGTALKPKPENMSKYCTFKALSAFEDLVRKIKTKYIVVSYNNTYNSKSHSSENKIKLEELKSTLERCGETKIFEHSHQYFNAGKTDFQDHKEFLFVTEVDHEKRDKAFTSVLCG